MRGGEALTGHLCPLPHAQGTLDKEMYSKKLPSGRDVAIALTNSAVFICRPARDRPASVHCAARAPLSPPPPPPGPVGKEWLLREGCANLSSVRQLLLSCSYSSKFSPMLEATLGTRHERRYVCGDNCGGRMGMGLV